VDLGTQRTQRKQRDTEDLEPFSEGAAPSYPHQELTGQIIGAAIEVHKELGPGFLEKIYENALKIELMARGLTFESQVAVPVRYKGQIVGNYVADLVVEDTVLCELKAVDALIDVHEAQLLNYLKATRFKIGLLLNFGQSKTQIKRLIN
jgi:GxxExxY protein